MGDKESNKGHGVIGTGNFELTVPKSTGVLLHHHEQLIKMAEAAISRSENALAIILAHAACEIFTERAFKLIFSFKKLESLFSCIVNPAWEYNNLKAKKVRDLYMVTTGDDITKDTKLWKKFLDHVKRRNSIAHRGETATRTEAEKSCNTVKEFIRHIEEVLRKIQPADWG